MPWQCRGPGKLVVWDVRSIAVAAQSYCKIAFSTCEATSNAYMAQYSPTQRIKEVPDHSAPRSLSKGMPGLEQERPQRQLSVCDALDVDCDLEERRAAHSSVGAGAQDSRQARMI